MRNFTEEDLQAFEKYVKGGKGVKIHTRSYDPNDSTYVVDVEFSLDTINRIVSFIYDFTESIEGCNVNIDIKGKQGKRSKVEANFNAPNEGDNYDRIQEFCYNRGFAVKRLFDNKSRVIGQITFGREDIEE